MTRNVNVLIMKTSDVQIILQSFTMLIGVPFTRTVKTWKNSTGDIKKLGTRLMRIRNVVRKRIEAKYASLSPKERWIKLMETVVDVSLYNKDIETIVLVLQAVIAECVGRPETLELHVGKDSQVKELYWTFVQLGLSVDPQSVKPRCSMPLISLRRN